MKKILFLITAICFAVGIVKGQDSIANNANKDHGELYIGYYQYGLQYGCPVFGAKMLKELTPKWSLGGGFECEIPLPLKANEMDAAMLPVKNFRVSAGKLGVNIVASYQLNRGFVMVEGWCGLCVTTIEACDERCEVDDGDGGTTQWYFISRVDGKAWKRATTCSIRVSYMLPVTKKVGVSFVLGYDLLKRINKELVNDNTKIHSSDWQSFENYYGQPSVNLYESSKAIRRVCDAGQFYFGICVGLFQ